MNWTEVGKPHAEGRHPEIERAINAFQWQPVPGKDDPPLQLPMAPGLALKEIIKEFRLKATHVAISHDLAPCGFYGVRASYAGGVVAEVYVLDLGHECIPLASRKIAG